jgi:hypothetical protein
MELTEAQIEKLRQSGIRLDADGRFWHEGGEVTHAGLRAALFRWLDRNPDGRYVLRLDERRFVYLDVDDAPFVVRSLRWEGDRAIGRLSDGSETEVHGVRLSPRGAYATVKGRFDARVSTAAWGVLAERMVERDGAVWLEAAGGPYRLGPATL